MDSATQKMKNSFARSDERGVFARVIANVRAFQKWYLFHRFELCENKKSSGVSTNRGFLIKTSHPLGKGPSIFLKFGMLVTPIEKCHP
jgi:hypothetical protein